MKKLTTNSKLIGCLMGLSIVALGTGCTDSDYDLSSVDSTIGVGGEGLELPTSSTENIILDDVLKLNNSDFVKIAANGDYMFNKDGDEATPSHPYINKIWVEKANVNNNFRLHITLPSQSANVAPLSWLDGGMSFSVNSFTASMGWVINAHPKGFNFFIGMDHILGKTSKEFIPLSSNASLNLGMNVTF